MARRTKVSVFLNVPDLEEPGSYLSEWVHEDGYSTDAGGVRLEWDGWTSSFFPWTSVLRVDWEPCSCVECRPAERKEH